MGLDISFKTAEAYKAGMDILSKRRGSDDELAEASNTNDAEPHPNYLDYLNETIHIATFKRANKDLSDLVTEVDLGTDLIFIRANKWGNRYEPLTNWLVKNNITWKET